MIEAIEITKLVFIILVYCEIRRSLRNKKQG